MLTRSYTVRSLQGNNHVHCTIFLSFIQESIQQNSITKSLKKAMIIIPLLKNKSLEVESLINYRPVSTNQLTIFHKIFETILCNQLNEYITYQNKLYEMQSAYTKFKITEKSLTLIVNNLLQRMTNISHLVLLDISAEFVTFDHIILIHCLYDIGIRSNALELIQVLYHRSYNNSEH